jgi:hypothetical protein
VKDIANLREKSLDSIHSLKLLIHEEKKSWYLVFIGFSGNISLEI